jgi:hypothetical protein
MGFKLDPESRNSAVCTATAYRLDGRWLGFRVPANDKKLFFSPRRRDLFCGSRSLISNGYLGLSGRGVKLTHPPSTSAEIKNTWMYTSNTPYVFKA